MNRYTVNFICTDSNGVNVTRSEEISWIEINEAIEMVKLKWLSWDIKILWAGIRLTDNQ
ncbi:MAG: hypothetical protein ACXW0H_07450 [Methylobacter sp.]